MATEGTDKTRAHLVGIAGSGMRSLADVFLDWGWRLSGSDEVIEPAEYLAARGVSLHGGHAAEYLPPDAEVVIASDAVPRTNPEICRAVERGIPVLSYAEMLGRIMVGRRGLAVAGTHGKSTTTAMGAELLVRAGKDPTVVYGAMPLAHFPLTPGPSPNTSPKRKRGNGNDLPSLALRASVAHPAPECRNARTIPASGGRAGGGDLMLVEACEYRANFLHLNPEQAVILGIEPDHFDFYRSVDQLVEAFAAFAQRLPDGGLLLARHDCERTRRAASDLRCRVETFGLSSGADWSVRGLRSRQGRFQFTLAHRGRLLGEVRLQVPGRANVLNALAAAALAASNGVPAAEIAAGLASFRGLRRRMESLGMFGGVALLDDYAHHPTQIAASLGAARQIYPGRRLWCVFQPHQASRTEHLLDELAQSLQNADMVVIAEIFRAREPHPPIGEVTAADLACQARAGGVEVAEVHQTDPILRLLESRLRPGDVLMTLGAGDVRKFCNAFICRFREDRAAG